MTAAQARAWRTLAMSNPIDYGMSDHRALARHVKDLDGGLCSPGARVRGILTLDLEMSERPGILAADGTPFRNQTFERCLHLSVSEFTAAGPQRASSSERVAWERLVFTPDERRLLVRAFERSAVVHVRLFLDEVLEPHKPTGEVYDRRGRTGARL